jgi:hypothetical protein
MCRRIPYIGTLLTLAMFVSLWQPGTPALAKTLPVPVAPVTHLLPPPVPASPGGLTHPVGNLVPSLSKLTKSADQKPVGVLRFFSPDISVPLMTFEMSTQGFAGVTIAAGAAAESQWSTLLQIERGPSLALARIQLYNKPGGQTTITYDLKSPTFSLIQSLSTADTDVLSLSSYDFMYRFAGKTPAFNFRKVGTASFATDAGTVHTSIASFGDLSDSSAHNLSLFLPASRGNQQLLAAKLQSAVVQPWTSPKHDATLKYALPAPTLAWTQIATSAGLWDQVSLTSTSVSFSLVGHSYEPSLHGPRYGSISAMLNGKTKKANLVGYSMTKSGPSTSVDIQLAVGPLGVALATNEVHRIVLNVLNKPNGRRLFSSALDGMASLTSVASSRYGLVMNVVLTPTSIRYQSFGKPNGVARPAGWVRIGSGKRVPISGAYANLAGSGAGVSNTFSFSIPAATLTTQLLAGISLPVTLALFDKSVNAHGPFAKYKLDGGSSGFSQVFGQTGLQDQVTIIPAQTAMSFAVGKSPRVKEAVGAIGVPNPARTGFAPMLSFQASIAGAPNAAKTFGTAVVRPSILTSQLLLTAPANVEADINTKPGGDNLYTYQMQGLTVSIAETDTNGHATDQISFVSSVSLPTYGKGVGVTGAGPVGTVSALTAGAGAIQSIDAFESDVIDSSPSQTLLEVGLSMPSSSVDQVYQQAITQGSLIEKLRVTVNAPTPYTLNLSNVSVLQVEQSAEPGNLLTGVLLHGTLAP